MYATEIFKELSNENILIAKIIIEKNKHLIVINTYIPN